MALSLVSSYCQTYTLTISIILQVSNVTLTAGTGYKVNLVNGTDPSQVFASSQEFEVKQAGEQWNKSCI